MATLGRPDPAWMRGQCWDMGVMLHQRTGLPLRGLFDADGTCHHAFVWDAVLEKGIDARGLQSFDQLRRGCHGQEMRPLSRGDIEKAGGWLGRELDKAEIGAAWRYAKKVGVLDGWLAAAPAAHRQKAEQMIGELMASHGFCRGEAVTALDMIDRRDRACGRAPLIDGTPWSTMYAEEMNAPLDAHLTMERAAHVVAYAYGVSVEEAAAHLAGQVESGQVQVESIPTM